MKDSATLIFSPDLYRNIILLFVGAVLTGIVVPTVKSIIDCRSAKSQKMLESDLARQKEIIDSQIKLLAEFSGLCICMGTGESAKNI